MPLLLPLCHFMPLNNPVSRRKVDIIYNWQVRNLCPQVVQLLLLPL